MPMPMRIRTCAGLTCHWRYYPQIHPGAYRLIVVIFVPDNVRAVHIHTRTDARKDR